MDNEEKVSDVRIIAASSTWIEGEAVRQLEATAQLPGMELAVGLPDLHPGKGNPVGAAFVSRGTFHPLLVGNDIGCGMAVHQTALPAHKLKVDRWEKRLAVLDEAASVDDLARFGAAEALHAAGLGTIGGGNHFAELHRLVEVRDEDAARRAGLDERRLLLLVHTGSRGLGEAVLRAHVDAHRGQGLVDGTPEAFAYLARHDQAKAWATANRDVVAARFLAAVGTEGRRVLDICHNEVVRRDGRFLHRKGAAPADEGLVVLPGSRGDESWLLMPTEKASATDASAWSLAHGAGRKWKRTECRDRLSARFTRDSLQRNRFGGRVICDDVDLLYEEAPQAYKDVATVVAALLEAGLVRVVGVMQPVLTFKTAGGRR